MSARAFATSAGVPRTPMIKFRYGKRTPALASSSVAATPKAVAAVHVQTSQTLRNRRHTAPVQFTLSTAVAAVVKADATFQSVLLRHRRAALH